MAEPSLTLRTDKGEKLTITEMDNNLRYLDKGYLNYFDISSGATTVIPSVNTWVKVNSTTTQGISKNGLSHSNNRITKVSEGELPYHVTGIIVVRAGAGDELEVAIFKNEELFPCSVVAMRTHTPGAGDRVNPVPFQCFINLDEDDFIEVYIRNVTDDTNVTLETLNMACKEI